MINSVKTEQIKVWIVTKIRFVNIEVFQRLIYIFMSTSKASLEMGKSMSLEDTKLKSGSKHHRRLAPLTKTYASLNVETAQHL